MATTRNVSGLNNQSVYRLDPIRKIKHSQLNAGGVINQFIIHSSMCLSIYFVYSMFLRNKQCVFYFV